MAGSVGQYTQGWFPWQGHKAATGTWTRTNLGGSLGMGRLQNTPAINDDITWDLYLDSGTWKFATIIQTESDAAIITVQLNGSTVGTVDGYSVGVVTGVYSEITGIVVASPAVNTLRLVAATKNASSTNYYVLPNSIAMIRTAGTPSSPNGSDLPGYTWHYIPWMGEKSAVGYSSRIQGTAYFGGGRYRSAGNQNDEVTWDIWIDTGTYRVAVIYNKNSDEGIMTLSLDGTSQGTIDAYAAGASDNNYSEITGLTPYTGVGIGVRNFKIKMATKNASSSGYWSYLHSVAWTRTGA